MIFAFNFLLSVVFVPLITGYIALKGMHMLDAALKEAFLKPPKQKPVIFWPRLGSATSQDYPRLFFLAEMSKREGHIFALLFCIFVGASFFFHSAMGVMCSVLYVCIILGWLAYRGYNRLQKFILQLPDAIHILIASLQAGYPLPQACQVIEREVTGLSKSVFGALVRAHALQVPLYQACQDIGQQLHLPDWDIVAEGFALQERVGGNAVLLFEEITSILRDKSRVAGELQSATAAGRLSGIIIALLAPLSFAAFYFFAPAFVLPVLAHPTGKLLLAFAACLELVGLYAIWKITKIDF